MQAIILCGGQGTRLQSVLPKGLPKPMVDVCGKPFLYYVLEFWKPFINRFVFAGGFGLPLIIDYFGHTWGKADIHYTNCTEGTIKAVKDSVRFITDDHYFVINGDTYFEINIPTMVENHRLAESHVTYSRSTRYDCHGGVDLVHRTAINLKPNFYEDFGYFVDIGTPEKLEEFRTRMAHHTN